MARTYAAANVVLRYHRASRTIPTPIRMANYCVAHKGPEAQPEDRAKDLEEDPRGIPAACLAGCAPPPPPPPTPVTYIPMLCLLAVMTITGRP
jgi:hypothetical protein